MCIFVEDWNCNFAGQEITLDICKTCIKARRLYQETKQDEALQKRKQMMDKQTREKRRKQDITSQSPKQKSTAQKTERRDESPIDALEGETSTDKPEEEDFLGTLEEKAFENKNEEQGIVDSIEDESPNKEIEEQGLVEGLEEESTTEKVDDEDLVETLEPNSIIEMENLQGSIEDIQDDPRKPTDTWLETNHKDENSFLKADFPNPPDKLQGGEDKQEFLVRVRRTEDEFFFPPYPEVNVKICEDGDVVAETGQVEVEDTHGEVISLPWDAGTLLDMYGTEVEIVVEGIGAGDEGAQNRIEIGAIGWLASVVKSIEEEGPGKKTLEEKVLSPLKEEAQEETIDAIQSDINPLE